MTVKVVYISVYCFNFKGFVYNIYIFARLN